MVTSTKGSTDGASVSCGASASSDQERLGVAMSNKKTSNSTSIASDRNGTENSSTGSACKKTGGAFTDFVNSRFASIERICNPISSGTAETTALDPASVSNSKSSTSTTVSNNNNSNSSTNEGDDDDDEAYATLTYLALLTSLYLPLLLFLWIRRSMFGTASLCRSLFLGHMLRLILAFMLLPPSTTKTFVPNWLWNLGVQIGRTAEKLWNDRRTQAIIPTWFHLLLAFVLGIENEKIPSSTMLANLGSCNEKDTSWPPPALVALGIFTVVAFVVHPDGLTWIVLGQIRVWIQDSIEKASDGISMIKDGTITITLAELSGTIAGIIIVVTIFRALVNPIEPTEKVRTPREKRNKHKRGKKGRGGRNHHHHNGNGGGGGGSGHGKGRIQSGHYRPSKELYEPPSSRSSSPSGRARSESDMEGTTVSTFSDVGMVSPSPCVGSTSSTATNNKQLERNVSSSQNELLKNNTTTTTSSSLDQTNKKSSPKRQQQQFAGNKKSCGGSLDKKVPSKQPSSSQHQQQMKHTASHPSETATVRVSGHRSQMSTNGDKQKRVHGKKVKRSKQHQRQNSPTNSEDTPKNSHEGNHISPSRQVKSHYKARKNHSEDHHHHSRNNNNNKARDFECDTTIGSNASYSHSDCQNNYSSPSYFSATSHPIPERLTTSRPKEERYPAAVQNRRRSFTDPNSSVPHRSLNGASLDQSLRIANDKISLVSVPSRVPLMEKMTQSDSLKVQSFQEVNRDSKRMSDLTGANEGLFDSNMAPTLYHTHDVGSYPRNQVYSQFDCQRRGFLGDNGSDGSPILNGLNNSVIRPPPGLVPSQQQNPVGHSSLIGHDLSESSHQSVPYLTSSSTSLYSNFSSNSVRNMTLNAPQSSNDHFITPSSNNVDYSQRNVTLPSISPRNYSAPAPIGHERDMRHFNDEEIEADLLALGGQMAGSILDF